FFHHIAGLSWSNQKSRICWCIGPSACCWGKQSQCNQSAGPAPGDTMKQSAIAKPGACCIIAGRRREGPQASAEGANSHNRTGTHYCESQDTRYCPAQRVTAQPAGERLPRQPTEGA